MYKYKLLLVFKTNAVLLLLVWNTVNADNYDHYDLYEYEYTGARYRIYQKYKGVSLIVSLTNKTVIYCMGFMVSDVNIQSNETHPYQYVLTSAGCVKHDNLYNIHVRIII